ncbi:MAG TPA: tetratricopeptide repeat protein [Bryobacteraceae bacterium]|nr:tetratricopeptide repeat protein [Bryobacteraceae bacterium]
MGFKTGRRVLVASLFGVCSLALLRHLPAQSAAPSPDSVRPDDPYSRKVAAIFDYRFGKEKIGAPGNAETQSDSFIRPGAFPSAAYCAHCHQEAYTQWRQSLHSNSFRTPFYRASVNILKRTKGIEYTRHCDSCHNPIAVVSGALTSGSNIDRKFDLDGLTCTTCHSIQGLQANLGNGSYVMGVPAVMTDENGQRIPGEVPDADILRHPDRHSKAVMRDFYRTSEFCGACHKANLPHSLNEYKWIRAFTSYDEWQNSKFSKRSPLVFYQADYNTCQNCHMKRAAATLRDYGAKNDTFASHRWPAGNTAVPFYYGFDEQLAKTIEFLKSGNYLNVDLFGIEPEGSSKMFGPLGSIPFRLEQNENVQVMVVVQNKNIGHSLVPEVRDLYETRMEFSVADAAGKEIYHSGFLKPDGSIDERAHSFTNRPVNMQGEFVDNHKVWTIHSMAYDNTIQAGRSALIRYDFHIPANIKGPLTVTARVNYRHLRQSYLNNVLGADHPAYPVIELASRTRTFNLGDNPVSDPQPNDNPDWMRWNNLGIAYLDQLQYADAIHAFNEVVKLRPDYVDGYINVGLTYIEWEKYSSARDSLEKALAMSASNARALYYLAIVERRSAHPDAEIADLQMVVDQYPKSRDARRELGISYYQQHQYDEAIKQFEALQAIDPDDVAAHYNLSILYRRIGQKQKASEQAALFATKQIDPGAPTYSLDFLRKHPEISVESVPWHMHKEQ